MGHYVSVKLRFEGQNIATKLLEPVFLSPFFKPVALGGVDEHRGGDNWFLSGYALEDFIARFLEKNAPKPAINQIVD